MLKRYSYNKTITCSAGGAATVYFGSVIQGRVVAINYTIGTIDGGATLTITGETSGVPIITKASAAAGWYYPRRLVNSAADGAAATAAFSEIYVYGERIKLIVSAGGVSTAGSMTIYTEEDQ